MALDLKEDEVISDYVEKINFTKQLNDSKIKETLSKSKELILNASIKNLEGYDTKLISKLLDKSSVSIDDEGNVSGLDEAVIKLAEEFPAIKKLPTPNISTNPASNQQSELAQLQQQLVHARATGNTTMVVALKNKIFGLSK